MIRVYDNAGNVIKTHEHAGEFYRRPALRELMPSRVYVLLLLVCCYFFEPPPIEDRKIWALLRS